VPAPFKFHFNLKRIKLYIQVLLLLLLFLVPVVYLATSFLPLDVASCCASIQLVPYDAVNRNKVSIRQLSLFIYFFFLTHYMFRPLRAILR
jgi:hypothetical protein